MNNLLVEIDANIVALRALLTTQFYEERFGRNSAALLRSISIF